jgi:hypothetical protein
MWLWILSGFPTQLVAEPTSATSFLLYITVFNFSEMIIHADEQREVL